MNSNGQVYDINNNKINEYKDKTYINVIFHEGYSFRNFIDILNCLGYSSSMVFNKDGILLSENGDGGRVLINVNIYAEELVKYEYISDKESHRITLDTSQLFKEGVKGVTKKRSLRLYKLKGEYNLRVQIISSYIDTGINGGVGIPIKLITQTKKIYMSPIYNIKYPTCTIPVNDFCERCRKFTTSSNILVASTHGFAIYATNDGTQLPKGEPFGNFEPDEYMADNNNNIPKIVDIDISNIDLSKININNNQITVYNNIQSKQSINGFCLSSVFIKALLKLNNLSSNGTIKFYIEKNKTNNTKYNALGIISKIGTYGILEIYVRQD